MKTHVKKVHKYEREYECDICGKKSRWERDILKCEKGHNCKCGEHYYELDKEEYDDYFDIKKICKICGTCDTITIYEDSYKDIWNLMSTQKLMESVDGNKNKN